MLLALRHQLLDLLRKPRARLFRHGLLLPPIQVISAHLYGDTARAGQPLNPDRVVPTARPAAHLSAAVLAGPAFFLTGHLANREQQSEREDLRK
jgi:hypothetical protein